MRHARIKKTTTNKTKTTTNDCGGIMMKSKRVWPEPLWSISTCFFKFLNYGHTSEETIGFIENIVFKICASTFDFSTMATF